MPTPRTEQVERGENAKGEHYITYKGMWDELLAEARARVAGSIIVDNLKMSSWQIRRIPGGQALLTYNCYAGGGGAWESGNPYTDRIERKCVRVEIPVERYGGPSEAMNANLYKLEQWKKETSYQLYNTYMYTDTDGVVKDLPDKTKTLAEKIRQGKLTVVRFYPVVTRTRTTKTDPGDAEKLSHIDTPPAYADSATKWLKMQDDITINANGTYTRTEMWQGADDWDINFYGNGAERWEFGTI